MMLSFTLMIVCGYQGQYVMVILVEKLTWIKKILTHFVDIYVVFTEAHSLLTSICTELSVWTTGRL